MYVSMKYLLDDANKNNYAIMAVNCINMEMARAVISAAEDEKSPIIINIGGNQMSKHAHPNIMIPLVKKLAEESKVPVSLNLDHGQNFDLIVSCIQNGFNSVMIDASSLPYEENIYRTSIVVKLAKPNDISVEAELGHVGQALQGDNMKGDLYTDPVKAKEFVDRTGVDALAVAIGTAHGNYPKGYIPKLDFERLRTLKKTLNMPLVLHGGSGSGEENIKKAVKNGINKINVCTDAFQAGKIAMLELLDKNPDADYMSLCIEAEKGIKKFVKGYIKIIGSNNRYIFDKSNNTELE